MRSPIEIAQTQLASLHELLSHSHRDVRNGIAVAHTFTTSEFIEIGHVVLDIKYSLEDAARGKAIGIPRDEVVPY